MIHSLTVAVLCVLLSQTPLPSRTHQGERGSTPASKPANGKKERWVPLFNGKNLDGWIPKFRGLPLGVNYKHTFRVENGVLRVVYDEYDVFERRFGHLFYKTPFSNYRLRLTYRFVGKQTKGGPGWAFRNSGIMVHGQSPQSMRLEQDFPVSIEVQLLGGHAKGNRPTANLCTPGTNVVMHDKLIRRHCINSTSPTFRGDDWITVEVEVRGNERVRHFVNGKLVLEYTKPQLDERDQDASKLIHKGEKMLHGGSISLQAESHPVEFRDIELLTLEGDAQGSTTSRPAGKK